MNRTLCRGLEILELLAENAQGLELNQVARSLNLPKSSAYNLLQTLSRLEYVHCAPDTGRYALGLRMFEVGSAAVNSADIRAVIHSHMVEINRQLNETMHLGVVAGKDALYIDKLESTRSIKMSSHVGLRLPLYSTAMGKAVLACLDDRQLAQLYPDGVLPALTPHTVDTVEALRHQLSEVRAHGYAVERLENDENICCVGVAIEDREGHPTYALSISVPAFRFDADEEAECGRLLLRAKRKIERVLKAL